MSAVSAATAGTASRGLADLQVFEMWRGDTALVAEPASAVPRNTGRPRMHQDRPSADVGDDAVDAAEGGPGRRQLGLRIGVLSAGSVGDGGAYGQQSLHHGATDAAGAAGDQESLARQTEIHVVSCL